MLTLHSDLQFSCRTLQNNHLYHTSTTIARVVAASAGNENIKHTRSFAQQTGKGTVVGEV